MARIPPVNQQMPSLRSLWRAWDQNSVSVSSRRLIYWIFTPIGGVGLVVMLVVGQWVAAGFMASILTVALVSGVRSPGTKAQRLIARLRPARGHD